MPLYEYRCDECQALTTYLWRSGSKTSDVVCKACGAASLTKIISRISVHRNMTSKMASLDPKYDAMVDRAVKNTPNADPNRLLSRMKPFDDRGRSKVPE
jgi:putative FmdB family regulatory protein